MKQELAKSLTEVSRQLSLITLDLDRLIKTLIDKGGKKSEYG